MKNNLYDLRKNVMADSIRHLTAFAFIAVVPLILAACSGDNVAGGSSGDAGITAVKDWEVAGVSQKGPFVTGSAVTVQELDGITLKQTGKSFKGSIKSDKGDFAIKDINLQSQYAILEASGYYRDEISGKKSSGTVTLRALTDLSNRKTVNINLLTHLEYERVMYLVTEKKKSIAEAKEQAEKEILASFGIDGDFAESEDLNIFESGDGNAALLAVSVLMQSDVDVAGLTERMGKFSIALAEGGSWDDADTKTAIADWACDVDLKGTIANIRRNVENWKYADSVPAFEKFVTNYWWNNYGLGVCNDKRENETKRNVNKLSKLYNEYFVCEKGRWLIPGSAKPSSSGSSDAKSSSSVYNPFNSSASQDSLSVLPSKLQFLEEFCYIRGPVVYGGGEQRVWTCTSWANVIDTATRDSAASALVDSLGKNGFAFEKTMLSDSLKSFYLHSFYDSLSYVYSAKIEDVVCKVAMTKTLSPAGAGYGAFMFDVVIFVMKDGFEDLPINISKSSSSSRDAKSSSSIYNPFVSSDSRDAFPSLPSQFSFIDSAYSVMGYKSYGDGKQEVWMVKNTTVFKGTNSRDSLAKILVDAIGAKGYTFEGVVKNDSVGESFGGEARSYDDTSYVYSKTENGTVYKVGITKSAVTATSLYMSYFFIDVKLVVLKDDFKEVPTVDYGLMRYEVDLPEEIDFINDYATLKQRSSYNNDSLFVSWNILHITDSSYAKSSVEKADLAIENTTMDSLEAFKAVLGEKGFVVSDSDYSNVPISFYTSYTVTTIDSSHKAVRYVKETSLAKYWVQVFVGETFWYNKNSEGGYANDGYYRYCYVINIQIRYKQKPERNKP